MIRIDGTAGEGGGQVLRSSLSLSALTGQPFTIDGIRGGRAKPGLLRQHLCAVRAAATLCGAEVEGDELRSQRLVFRPGRIRGGRHLFEVGSAGSAGLVVQTILPLLLRAEDPSEITVTGGTHNRASPPADFLQHSFMPRLRSLGAQVQLEVAQVGFEPVGGGRYVVQVEPTPLASTSFEAHGPVTWTATILGANLRKGVLPRQRDLLVEAGVDNPRIRRLRADGQGNAVVLLGVSDHGSEVFTGFGRRGYRSEQLVADVLAEARAWEAHDVPIGEHTADQLILPLWMGGGGSLRTVAPSRHTLTQLDVLRAFTGVEATVSEDADGVRIRV